ncbi:MAG: class I SAM-dependent methyltransferase [Gammaproteobacteria bacterium]
MKLTLPWTGERYIPGIEGNIVLEHTHRYLLAREFVHGKKVLDIASGEGYGSNFLSEVAESVIGVDIAEDAVNFANQQYKKPGIEFRVGSCSTIPLENGSVDVVVSFETIEHHDEHEAMMAEIKRVLRPNGLLIMSSPDRHEYSDVPGNKNPFHVKELYQHEFEQLLNAYFAHAKLFGQRVVHGSSISCLSKEVSDYVSYHGDINEMHKSHGVIRPEYFIALASDGPLPSVPHSFFTETVDYRQSAGSMMVQKMDEHNIHQAELRESLASIYASRSWRLTAPLRKIGEMWRRVRKSLS